MDTAVVRALNGLNRRFYGRFGESFSDTRQAPWPGWDRLARLIGEQDRLPGNSSWVRVLDAGCGNCRFERFLLERFPQVKWQFLLMDSAPEPAMSQAKALVAPAQFAPFDMVEGLLAGEALPFAEADLTVAFGLMHHIPSEELRAEACTALIAATRPGGLIAISFWQFLSDAGLAAKARETTAAAAPFLQAAGVDPARLAPHDCILGWQDEPFDEGAVRYCHHFDDNEIDRLVEAACARVEPPARLVARYRADGRTGALNAYAVIER